MLDNDKKNLIVIDGFQGNHKVGEVAENYFNNARKYNCNIILHRTKIYERSRRC